MKQLELVPLRCSVLDIETIPHECYGPVRYIVLPGPTAHCELHGVDAYRKREGYRIIDLEAGS